MSLCPTDWRIQGEIKKLLMVCTKNVLAAVKGQKKARARARAVGAIVVEP